MPSDWPIGRDHLSSTQPLARMVSHLVATLSSDGHRALYDLTRTNRQPPRIAPELERTILNIRRRRESPIHP
jgi:hypothetical protein